MAYRTIQLFIDAGNNQVEREEKIDDWEDSMVPVWWDGINKSYFVTIPDRFKDKSVDVTVKVSK